MGWFVGCCDARGTKFWEIESGELQLGRVNKDIEGGDAMSMSQIQAFVLMKCRKHQVQLFITESNSNGETMIDTVRQAEIPYLRQNFGSNKNSTNKRKKGVSRAQMCGIVRQIMDDQCLFIKNPDLAIELAVYNPDTKKKGENEEKGDMADAFIHCVYRLAARTHSHFIRKNKSSMYTEVAQK